jgi:DeoR family transcriptional regulator, suf operon transcriptional repressor
MDVNMPGLAGQKGLKGDILLALKKAQPMTANEFAVAFGVTANAVRRHLKELEAEGLISYGREQRGNGAPTYAYRLSTSGEALFPNRYEEALTRLLKHVVEREGRDAALSVLERQYSDLKEQLAGRLDTNDPVERIRALTRVLGDAGYMAEYEHRDGELKLTMHNCAIRAAVACLPEVCETELRFVESVMSAPVERGAHIIDGCNACEYVVKAPSAEEPAA